MAIKKILTDISVDGDINADNLTVTDDLNIGDNDNVISLDSGNLNIFGDGGVRFETGDGTVVEMSDVMEITGDVQVTGNISATNLSGTNTGDQDLSGYALTSHNHNYILATDDRDVKPNTTSIGSTVKGIQPFFTSLGGMTGSANYDYQDLLVLDTYSDTSGGNANAITLDKSDGSMRIWNASHSATTWGTAKRVYTDSDFNIDDYALDSDKVSLTGNETISGNKTFNNSVTANQLNLKDGGDYITFYGGDQTNHSITSRNASGAFADDLRFNTYGGFLINLDSNNNNGSGANFIIGNHGDSTGSISSLFSISGETGAVSAKASLAVDGGIGVATSGGTLIVKQKGNTANDGIAITSSHANSHRIWKDSSGRLNIGSSANTTALVQDVSGNLGIGTNSPQDKLEVQGSIYSTPISYAASQDAYALRMGANSNTAFDMGIKIKTSSGGTPYMSLRSHSDEDLLVLRGGNVGIGKDDPLFKLDIVSGSNNGIKISQQSSANTWNALSMLSYVTEAQANALADSSYIFTTNPSSQTQTAFSKFGGLVIQGRDDGNSSFAIRLGSGSGHSTKMFMSASGATTFSSYITATNFILSSDSRLKKNVEEVDNKSINVDWKTFEMKSNKGQKRYGVIAQELEEVHPEFVRTDEEGMKSVAYVDLLIAKIAELEARLDKASI